MHYFLIAALLACQGCVSYRWKQLAIAQSAEIEKANEAMERALPMLEQCVRIKKNCGRNLKF